MVPWQIVFAFLVFLPLSFPQVEGKQSSQRFLLLSTLRTSTLQGELNQAAKAGYAVMFAPNVGGDSAGASLPQAFNERNQLLLEKLGENEGAEYFFVKPRGESLVASLNYLENDMGAAAAKGFRFVPRTFLGLMERRDGAASSQARTYRVLQSSSKDLQEEICGVSRAGFRFLDLLGKAVVMEKEGGAAGARDATCPYLVLGARTEGTLRRELNAAAARGYRVVAASSPGEIVVVLEKSPSTHEYLILDSMRIAKLQADIAGAAQRGFRAIPRGFIRYSVTNVALMEKGPSGEGPCEYRILQTGRAATLQSEIVGASEQGFRPVAMNDSRTVLLEKKRM